MNKFNLYPTYAIVFTMASGFGGCVSEGDNSLLRRAIENNSETVVQPTTNATTFVNYPATNQKRRIALVIGNSSYQNVPPLLNPANDAIDIAKALRQLGFEVEEKEDVPDQRTMRDLVARFGEKLQGGGVGLFYYSGHGIQIKGENYLIPTSAQFSNEGDVDYESLGMKYVQTVMDNAQNGMNLIILDACRDDPFTRSIRVSKRGGGITRGLAQMDSIGGSLIAFSTAPGATAEDGSGRNGTYTKNLLAHINTPGITVEGLFKRVRVGVSQETGGQQIPWESSSLTGEFCFAGCTDVIAAAREQQLRQELNQLKTVAATEKTKFEQQKAQEIEQARREAEQQAAAEQARFKEQRDQEQARREAERQAEAEQLLFGQSAQAKEQAQRETERQTAAEQARLKKQRARQEQARWKAEQQAEKQRAAEQARREAERQAVEQLLFGQNAQTKKQARRKLDQQSAEQLLFGQSAQEQARRKAKQQAVEQAQQQEKSQPKRPMIGTFTF